MIRNVTPHGDNPPPPTPLNVWKGYPKEEKNWLNLQPIYSPEGELLYHPTLDVEQYNAERKAKRYLRRRKMWGRLCWGWWLCVMLWICAHNKQFTPEIRDEEIRNVQRLTAIAFAPAMIRGFWHRFQGE